MVRLTTGTVKKLIRPGLLTAAVFKPEVLNLMPEEGRKSGFSLKKLRLSCDIQ